MLLTLGSFSAQAQVYPRGDVNQDNEVSIADVTCLINYLLTGYWPDEPVTPPDSHEYVDLGLPSGTLWATCNIGANVPEEYGDYFAWGETEPKETYDWSTYKWSTGNYDTLTKYCSKSNYGYNDYTDDKTELEPEDDAAYVNWGPSWRMPTRGQQDELREQCNWMWTTQNGVNGWLVTGPNGNTLFLSAAGYHNNSSLDYAELYGFYWSRTLFSGYPSNAYDVDVYSGAVNWSYHSRSYGFPVRPVRTSQN